MDVSLIIDQNQVIFNDVPPEILLYVFSYLDGFDLLRCRAVCKSWSNIASDGFLWQKTLCEVFGNCWFVVSCDSRISYAPDFSNLNSIQPHRIFQFLSKFVPSHMLLSVNSPTSEEVPSTIHLLSDEQQSSRQSASRAIARWWDRWTQRLFSNNIRQSARRNFELHRFAVFGPGFDQRATSRLFSQIVDMQTKSFEPVSMIPGHMGFGAGLTLKLFAEAQLCAMDSSLQPPQCHSPTKESTLTDTNAVTCFSTESDATPPANCKPSSKRRRSVSLHRRSPSGSTEFKNFVFDLHYLYSQRGHLTQFTNDPLERLVKSRLFDHSDTGHAALDEAEILNNLSVSTSMSNILRGLNGLIYALDARMIAQHGVYLYHELCAVLRGLPENISTRIPITILYIMPKEDIALKPYTPHVNCESNTPSNIPSLVENRDSYSGVKYTVSWRGSLLLPISCLRLFELINPWRVQKCASNDMKAVIQAIIWLRERAPPLSTEAE